jgi:hypothetical protein
MSSRCVVKKSPEGEYLCTGRDFSFKKMAARNQWFWGPRGWATVFDSEAQARAFAKQRVRKPVVIVPLD